MRPIVKQILVPLFMAISIMGCTPKKTESTLPPLADSLKGTFWDYTLPVDQRVTDLLNKLTIDEKAGQMLHSSPAIERLNIPSYNWWNEALHGIARAGKATVFPQAIALGATFDDDLIFRIATAISDEGRAKFNAAQNLGNHLQYMGLTYWSPNVNIFRDPRWGRGHETYGEDPFLSGQIGAAFVRGIQGDNPNYLKAAACAKHYVVHSGPEALRHEFNAKPPLRDFYETYLPAFKTLVTEANVEAVMCAYNRTYDLPCCGSNFLLQDILRNQWGFDGHIVSDCGALNDFHAHHKITPGPAESAAMAINAGVNVNCGMTYSHLTEAIGKGLIEENTIDRELRWLLNTRFRLGMFDPSDLNPYNKISADVIHSQEHIDLAREAAQKAVVLLKNKNNVLPLKKDLKDIQVVGIHGNDAQIAYGNYYGQSPNVVTIIEGITEKVDPGTRLEFRQGHLLKSANDNPIDWTTNAAKRADVVIAVMGISQLLEGEEGEAIASDFKGDRIDIELPEVQINYLKKLRSKGDKPIVLILTGGSPISIAKIEDLVDAILFVWYPGEQGGSAIADVIFGDVNPSGRLPITFPKSLDQLPDYIDYSMKGRTYKYMELDPLYPFGFGLSYTEFTYDEITTSNTSINNGESIGVSVKVTNTGNVDGDEVVQLYLTDLEASTTVPFQKLVGFKRIHLKSGESKTISFEIKPEQMMITFDDGTQKIESGEFKLVAGGSSPNGTRVKEENIGFKETKYTVL